MAIVSSATLKGYFESGDTPTEAQFIDLIDTMFALTRWNIVSDPGDAGAIPVTNSGYCALVTAGVETRTLAQPTFIAQELLIYLKTFGGQCTVTCGTTVNEAGNNTITFTATGQSIRLIGCEQGAGIRWRCAVADPTTILSTV